MRARRARRARALAKALDALGAQHEQLRRRLGDESDARGRAVARVARAADDNQRYAESVSDVLAGVARRGATLRALAGHAARPAARARLDGRVDDGARADEVVRECVGALVGAVVERAQAAEHGALAGAVAERDRALRDAGRRRPSCAA